MLLGAGQSLFGPALEPLATRFSIDLSAVSLIISLYFLGAGTAILAAGLLVRRFGYARVLGASAALMMLGGLLIGVAPTWPLVLAAALVMGVGFGVLNISTNLVLLRHFQAHAAAPVNMLAALFGVGAILGPLLLGALLPRVGLPFMLVALLAAFAIVPNLRLPEPGPLPPKRNGLPAFGPLLGFLVLLLVYVASEVSGAAWEATHLTPYFGVEQAAYLTSLYWLALTIGRFIATPLSAHISPQRLVLGAAALALVGALLTHVIPIAPAAYMLLGFAFAPIFPTSLVWLQHVFPGRVEQVTPLVMSVANFGAVISAPVIGLAVTRYGSDVIPSALSLSVALLVVLVLLLINRTRTPAA